jgi:hypothetical protein
MPKRNRVRARARRPEATSAARADRDHVERADGDRRARGGRYRGAPLPPGGSHAIGEPSPTMERAATMERAFVVKDFGRLVKVIALMLVLLALSGVAVNTLVR